MVTAITGGSEIHAKLFWDYIRRWREGISTRILQRKWI
jgi:hypothetical protein